MVHRVLSMAEACAQGTKLWCSAAAVMAATGGRRGRRAAGAGVAAMALAQLVGNGVAKRVVDRPRPPKEWIPHDKVEERPASPSFPSGHTAAATAFCCAVLPAWPAAALVCTVPAVLVAVERVHSGAHYPSDVTAGALIGLAGARLVRHAART
ncbi:phosphatase PAP2 family protein [Streptomyces collinus]|uniref:phosphatase PAP2 family protein n=1 Tax=Streptomyces collinus TaxID=42684 RepID=UPI00332A0A09